MYGYPEKCPTWEACFAAHMATRPFKHDRHNPRYLDCTLICGPNSTMAERWVLMAESTLFKPMLDKLPTWARPVMTIEDVDMRILELVLDYMYTGESNIPPGDLVVFVQTVAKLKVKGLLPVEILEDAIPAVVKMISTGE